MAVARMQSIGIRETLTSMLPAEELERLARESGALRRRRKIDPAAMFWCVVLGFGAGRERTLAGLRRSYARATGELLVPSAFYDRFTRELARMFRARLRSCWPRWRCARRATAAFSKPSATCWSPMPRS